MIINNARKEKAKRMLLDGCSYKQIVASLGIPRWTVAYLRRCLELPARKPGRPALLVALDEVSFRSAWITARSNRDLATTFGLSAHQLYRVKLSMNLPHRRRGIPQIAIRHQAVNLPRDSGMNVQQIALAMRISKQRVSQILSPTKQAARQVLTYAIKTGKISRPPSCQKCRRSGKVQAHHTDYSKPLEVQWLCSNCHYGAHTRTLQPAA